MGGVVHTHIPQESDVDVQPPSERIQSVGQYEHEERLGREHGCEKKLIQEGDFNATLSETDRQTTASGTYLEHVEKDEEDEERVAVDIECVLPLDALLHEKRITNALAEKGKSKRSLSAVNQTSLEVPAQYSLPTEPQVVVGYPPAQRREDQSETEPLDDHCVEQ